MNALDTAREYGIIDDIIYKNGKARYAPFAAGRENDC